MSRFARMLPALLVPVLLLAACETVPAPQRVSSCRAIDWFSYGLNDGRYGIPMADRDGVFADCAALGFPADLGAYRAGHAEGLLAYCTAASGYDAGLNGRPYHGVCPPGPEAEFLQGYERGRGDRPVGRAPYFNWWPFILHDHDRDHRRRDRDDDGARDRDRHDGRDGDRRDHDRPDWKHDRDDGGRDDGGRDGGRGDRDGDRDRGGGRGGWDGGGGLDYDRDDREGGGGSDYDRDDRDDGGRDFEDRDWDDRDLDDRDRDDIDEDDYHRGSQA